MRFSATWKRFRTFLRNLNVYETDWFATKTGVLSVLSNPSLSRQKNNLRIVISSTVSRLSTLSAPLAFASRSSPIYRPLRFHSTQNSEVSKDGIWTFIDQKVLLSDQIESRVSPRLFRTSHLNQTALARLLARAPREFAKTTNVAPAIIGLPMPHGRFANVRIMESPIMEPALAARFPEIKTYRGQGIDDPTITTRFDWTPSGFHAIVLSSHGTMVVEPFDAEQGNYLSYYEHDLPDGSGFFECLSPDEQHTSRESHQNQSAGRESEAPAEQGVGPVHAAD